MASSCLRLRRHPGISVISELAYHEVVLSTLLGRPPRMYYAIFNFPVSLRICQSRLSTRIMHLASSDFGRRIFTFASGKGHPPTTTHSCFLKLIFLLKPDFWTVRRALTPQRTEVVVKTSNFFSSWVKSYPRCPYRSRNIVISQEGLECILLDIVCAFCDSQFSVSCCNLQGLLAIW